MSKVQSHLSTSSNKLWSLNILVESCVSYNTTASNSQTPLNKKCLLPHKSQTTYGIVVKKPGELRSTVREPIGGLWLAAFKADKYVTSWPPNVTPMMTPMSPKLTLNLLRHESPTSQERLHVDIQWFDPTIVIAGVNLALLWSWCRSSRPFTMPFELSGCRP